MYLMSISYYPYAKGDEVIQKYFEVMEKYPPDETVGTVVLPSAGRTTKDGYEVYSVSELKKGKLEEATANAAKILREFHVIEGYRYELIPLRTAEEAIELYGMGK